MKKKSVKEIVERFFNDQIGINFNVYNFVKIVQKWLGWENRFASEGSILRRLRELREEGKINYKVVNSKKGTYRKLRL